MISHTATCTHQVDIEQWSGDGSDCVVVGFRACGELARYRADPAYHDGERLVCADHEDRYEAVLPL